MMGGGPIETEQSNLEYFVFYVMTGSEKRKKFGGKDKKMLLYFLTKLLETAYFDTKIAN